MTGFFNYIAANPGQVLTLVIQHLELTFISVGAAIILGVPLGILITYVRGLNKPVLGFANTMQAIPSLALLGLLIPVLGIGMPPAIFMVVLYSLLPIIKNTSTGLNNINKDMIEAAGGIGMTDAQILTRVKLPLALPVIMAGIRIAAVTAVGLVTIAAFIGAGGLGYLVYAGIRTVNTSQILAGAIPACIIALLIDFLASMVEKAVTPISFRPDVKSIDKEQIQSLKTRKKLILIVVGLISAGIIGFSLISNLKTTPNTVVIGSKDFTESNILGNIFAQLVDENTDLNVDTKLSLGGTQVAFSSVQNGDIDMYVEYTGTVYGSILGQTERLTPDETYARVKKELADQYQLTMLEPLGFNNTYTVAVRKDTADRYRLKNITDLASVSHELVASPTLENMNRPDGMAGLIKLYGLNFREILPIDGTPRYTALESDECQVIDAFATDGLLAQFDLVVLEDDRQYFPPYYAAPVVRPETLKKYPQLEKVFNTLQGKLSDEVMRSLNYQVDVEKRRPREVAREFLEKEGLIQKTASME